MKYSYDGSNWNSTTTSSQNGNVVLWTKPQIGTMTIQHPTIIGGSSTTNTIAYSKDGIFYKGIGNTIFSESCNHIAWNGTMWVAGGKGIVNTLAYSYDGITWNGLGSAVFSLGCNYVTWNGTVWMALGCGGNTIATSTNGLEWTGQGTDIFDICGNSVDWNGLVWVVGGMGTNNTLAVNNSATAFSGSWTLLSNTMFDTACNSVLWMNNKWIIGGYGYKSSLGYNATMAYTSDIYGLTSWTYSTTPTIFGYSTNSIYWNGQIAVAVGTSDNNIKNTIATSSDGITWTGLGNSTFTAAGFDIKWNTKRWVAAGTGGNTIAYSYDGKTWYGSYSGNAFTSAYAVGTNSKIGSVIVNSTIYFNTNDTLAVNTPEYYDDSLLSDTAITFNLNLP
jgi:hypothetical protein